MDITTIQQIQAALAEITKKVNELTSVISQPTTQSTSQPSDVFPAANIEFTFPSGKKGTAAYLNGSGVYRKYELSAEEVLASPTGKFVDSATSFIELKDVTTKNLGQIYKIPVENPAPVYFTPVLNIAYPARQYKVYFGHPYNPQGQIVYFDGNNQSKAITKFGVTDVITATKFTQLSNVKLVAL